MWYLTSEGDPRVLYILPKSKGVIIGRSVDTQNCDFAIPEDPSLSRRHAAMTISDNNLFVEDLGSRYGTFINDSHSQIESRSTVKLNVNDQIKFGKLNSVWKVNEVNFVTCTSTLKGENLQNMKMSLGNLGGTLKNEWDDTCAYLTMPAITLTIKVVLALVQGSHIVTTEFWTKCLEAVNSNAVLPDPCTYTPQVVESTLNKENVSFLPNYKRKTLFAGKKFIFFSRRQLEMYKAVLLKSSAVPLLLSDSKMTKSMLCDHEVIVIQYNLVVTNQETQTQRNQIDDITNYLKTKGKRVVADAEIGLAILFCSMNKYCNPDFNFTSEVIKQTGENMKTSNILAQESQEPGAPHKKENVIINESLVSNHDHNGDNVSSSKRKLSTDSFEIETNVTKKIATENSKVASSNERVKRKFNEDNNETSSNPNKKVAIDNGEIFNFMNPVADNKENNTGQKKLNFSKNLKRKAEFNSNENEDDLFNFIEDQSKASTSMEDKTTHSIFDNKKTRTEEENANTKNDTHVNDINNKHVDISALRGAKLKELNKANSNWISTDQQKVEKIKQEPEDYDLELGSIILRIRNDLIVKKESPIIEAQNNQVKNFKKFKKVWPVKMQVTVIPSTSMSIIKPATTEMCSMVYSDNQ